MVLEVGSVPNAPNYERQHRAGLLLMSCLFDVQQARAHAQPAVIVIDAAHVHDIWVHSQRVDTFAKRAVPCRPSLSLQHYASARAVWRSIL